MFLDTQTGSVQDCILWRNIDHLDGAEGRSDQVQSVMLMDSLIGTGESLVQTRLCDLPHTVDGLLFLKGITTCRDEDLKHFKHTIVVS